MGDVIRELTAEFEALTGMSSAVVSEPGPGGPEADGHLLTLLQALVNTARNAHARGVEAERARAVAIVEEQAGFYPESAWPEARARESVECAAANMARVTCRILRRRLLDPDAGPLLTGAEFIDAVGAVIAPMTDAEVREVLAEHGSAEDLEAAEVRTCRCIACNFCGLQREECRMLVASEETGTKICDGCVTRAIELFKAAGVTLDRGEGDT